MKPKKKNDTDNAADYVVKAVIIGDSGVGKTNILLRFCDNTFKPSYASTIGIDFKIKTIQVEECKIKLQIWDTAGQQKFKNISTTFYKGALIIILTYSIDQAQSFQNVQTWVKQIHQHSSEQVSIFLVGNKLDLRQNRKISIEEGEKLAQKYGMIFKEVSAKDGTNIKELFQIVGKESYDRIKKLGEKYHNPGLKLQHNNEEDSEAAKTCFC